MHMHHVVSMVYTTPSLLHHQLDGLLQQLALQALGSLTGAPASLGFVHRERGSPAAVSRPGRMPWLRHPRLRTIRWASARRRR